MNTSINLRSTIETAIEADGRSLSSLTVMSNLTDPYRIDTPANRRDAEWLAQAWETSGSRRPIHLRGLHYALVSTPDLPLMPDGQPYLNTTDCWIWLQSIANRARWLGYIDFEDINDERNAAPAIHTDYGDAEDGMVYLSGNRPTLWTPPEFSILLPEIVVDVQRARQAYRLAFIGEKQSLADVLDPIARSYRAELVLPTGELSTTLLYGIAKRAAEDGRPCRLFYLSDFDPTGFHMPIEVSRKLQALVDQFFPDLDVQLRRCALTAEQVEELGLPSTPMKETERRADKWRERFGVEQTEIDALATLRPRMLSKIVREAVAPYWDDDLDDRTLRVENQARAEARDRFQTIIELKAEQIAVAESLLAEVKETTAKAWDVIKPIVDEIVVEADGEFDEIEIETPDPEPEGDVDEPLFCSDREWVEQTEILREEKL